MPAADTSKDDTAALIRYDQMHAEVSSLSHVDAELRLKVDEQASKTMQLQRLHAELQEVQQGQQLRLHKLKKSAGAHVALKPQLWLNGGVRAQIERHHKKLDELTAKEKPLAKEAAVLSTLYLPALDNTISELKALKARKQSIEEEMDETYASLVAKANDSLLAELNTVLPQWQSRLSKQELVQEALLPVAAGVRSARQHFAEAKVKLLKAIRFNEEARSFMVARVNAAVLWIQETELNALTQHTRDSVIKGVGELQRAFSQIKPEVMWTHAEEAAGLGEVRLPLLAADPKAAAQGLFEGTKHGDFTVGANSAKKLTSTLPLVHECLDFVEDQVLIVEKLERAIKAAIRKSAFAIRWHQDDIAHRKQIVFEELRSKVGVVALPKKPTGAPAAVDALVIEQPAAEEMRQSVVGVRVT